MITYSEWLGDAYDLLKGLEVGVDDDSGMDLSLEEALDCGHDLSRQDDNWGGAVADLLVLSSRQLDHALSCGVRNVDLLEKLRVRFQIHMN